MKHKQIQPEDEAPESAIDFIKTSDPEEPAMEATAETTAKDTAKDTAEEAPEEKPEDSTAEDTAMGTTAKDAAEEAPKQEEEKESPLSKLDLNNPDVIAQLRKALNIEAELAAARAAGEIAGRNAKISELMQAPDPQGDGLPFHGSGCASTPNHPQSIFQLADQAR